MKTKLAQDHPRTCGEKVSNYNYAANQLGSPPHMRGKAVPFAALARNVRITPAHAGKSVSTLKIRLFNRDHPRTCGEKHSVALLFGVPVGSPPHMRGKV